MKQTKIVGTQTKPRISVFRSNRYIYAQAVDDKNRETLCAYSSLNIIPEMKNKRLVKQQQAKLVGLRLAEKLKKTKINQAVFDRGTNKYHGRTASLAEGLREGGIKI